MPLARSMVQAGARFWQPPRIFVGRCGPFSLHAASGLTVAPASRQAMGMGDMDGPTIATEVPTPGRSRFEAFLRGPDGVLALARLLLPEEVSLDLAPVGRLVLRPGCVAIAAEGLS